MSEEEIVVEQEAKSKLELLKEKGLEAKEKLAAKREAKMEKKYREYGQQVGRRGDPEYIALREDVREENTGTTKRLAFYAFAASGVYLCGQMFTMGLQGEALWKFIVNLVSNVISIAILVWGTSNELRNSNARTANLTYDYFKGKVTDREATIDRQNEALEALKAQAGAVDEMRKELDHFRFEQAHKEELDRYRFDKAVEEELKRRKEAERENLKKKKEAEKAVVRPSKAGK